MTPSRRKLVARAHAKVNLDLRVLGTRPDGFHELRTVFQAIELHDTLMSTERPGPFTVKCRMPGVPLDEGNLVWQRSGRVVDGVGRPGAPRDVDRDHRQEDSDAGRTRRRERRRGRGAPGAGALVGRRAADAAARGRHRSIGADVPFFLSGGTALGLGLGEEIYPLVDLPPHWIVIVQPPFGVSTAEAYSWYDDDRTRRDSRRRASCRCCPVPWPTRAAQMINDLEPPVVRRHPEITGLKTALREAGAVASAMSGSGSAVFGLFRSQRRGCARRQAALERRQSSSADDEQSRAPSTSGGLVPLPKSPETG